MKILALNEKKNVINDIIKKNNILSLATSLNGLPSVSLVQYTYQNNQHGIDSIFFALEKTSIENNQILFNKNCSFIIGRISNPVKIYGRALVLNRQESLLIFSYYDEKMAYYKIKIESITLNDNFITLYPDCNSNNDLFFSLKSNIKTEIQFWFKITRAAFFTATIMPILLGIVLSYILIHSFSPEFSILTLLAGLFIHSGTNLINDFFDQRTDNLNENFTSFNGGSRTIQQRLASQEKVLASAITSFMLGILIVLFIVIDLQSRELFILLLMGLFLAFFYSAKPLKLSHHGLGELSNFLGYGPILTIASFIIQSNNSYTVTNLLIVFYWSFVPGLLLVLILLINEFQDYDSDKISGKKTLIVRIGKNKGKFIYNLISILNYVMICFGIFLFYKFSALVVISFVGLILVYKTSKILNSHIDKVEELLPANALTVENHLLTNLLLIIGFLFSNLIIL